MARASNREKLLIAGLGLIHEHGYNATSVRDVVRAAGVPQGCFTNHFTSKEAFGLEVLGLYRAEKREDAHKTLLDDNQPPLERIRGYIDARTERFKQNGMRCGCMFGNFAAESSSDSEAIRLKLLDIFAESRRAMSYCLEAAVRLGKLPKGFDCHEAAAFILSSLQGAFLAAKTERTPEPVERFKKFLFASILR
ncbi:TetR family transcriptional regulator C-terminal domain-containing protein [Labrys sp. LIt4]|uniref:TetR/AcrR family transcriptional regulator n=1 Tax=Labrys sp. LIt4 TaxID=2821355 RepID=UPI001AE0BAD7|nr:TetR/AcrR family transcriptional regulator [Labrys sp. LIt4]MBP0578500.1 TetR family transcriptional regulator C-terminal domain-containing protein [Labrys sp. LIt4]